MARTVALIWSLNPFLPPQSVGALARPVTPAVVASLLLFSQNPENPNPQNPKRVCVKVLVIK